MNTLLALDRYNSRGPRRRPSASPVPTPAPATGDPLVDLVTQPGPSRTLLPSNPNPTRPRNRLIRTLTPNPPSQSRGRTRTKRTFNPATSRRRKRTTRQKEVDLAQRKGWWGASLVGVDVLWGGLWRAIFGEERAGAGPSTSEEKLGHANSDRTTSSHHPSNPLSEKPPLPTEDGAATSSSATGSSSSSESDTDDDNDSGWIDPVTRAPETEEGLAAQLIGVEESAPPPSSPSSRERGRSGRELETPPSFRLRSFSPVSDLENGLELGDRANSTEQDAKGAAPRGKPSSSILINPSPTRRLKREDRSEDVIPILSSNDLTAHPSSPSTSLSKRKKLLPNPIGRRLLTPAHDRPSAFDRVPTGISLTSFNSSSTFSAPYPSAFNTSIFGASRSYGLSSSEETKRKIEHHRLEQFFQAQQRAPSITRTPTPFHLPKTLILDLDETLIHSTSRPMSVQSSGMGGGGGLLGVSLAGLFPGSGRRGGGGGRGEGHTVEVVLGGRSTLYHVYKRPFVDHFLKKVSSWYTLVIFTASMQEYADPVIDWLDGGRGLFGKKLYRESCSLQPNGSYTKDLSLVEDDLSRVCFMDNSPISYNWNKANALPIEGWTSDPNDEALLDMLPVLDSLRFTSDVRRVLGIRGF